MVRVAANLVALALVTASAGCGTASPQAEIRPAADLAPSATAEPLPFKSASEPPPAAPRAAPTSAAPPKPEAATGETATEAAASPGKLVGASRRVGSPQLTWTVKVQWQRPMRWVSQAPRLGNGLVYAFIGADILAMEAATGELKWGYVAPALQGEAAALGCPCASTTGDFTGKDVYVLAGGNELRALDATSGQARWAQRVGRAITTPTVSFDGIVVVGAVSEEGSALYGLDQGSGAIRWKTPITGRPVPWLALEGSTVLSATADRRLVAVDASSGAERWTTRLPQEATLPFLDRVGGGALAIAADGSIRLLEAETGRQRWSAEVKDWPGQPLRAHGRVYAATVSGQVLALDEQTGEHLWAVHTARSLDGNALAFGDGALYVPTLGRELVAIGASDGQVRWSKPVGQMLAAPIVHQRMLVGGTTEGDVVLLDTASGEELARVKVGEAVPFSPVLGEAFIYAVADGREGSVLTALQAQKHDE